jgi:ribosome maturation factor RimP
VPADRSALRQSIIGLLEPELEAMGFALLDVRLFAGGGRLHLRIFVDAAGGIDLAGCTRASRTAEMLLEESKLLAEAYVIEVSSPGVRRPLRKREHFAEHLGQRIDLRLERGARATALRGELLAVAESGLRVRPLAPGPAAGAAATGLDADAGEDEAEDGAGPSEADLLAADAREAAANAAGGEAASGGEADTRTAGGATPADAAVLVGWDEIESANLDPDFDIHALINADRRRRKAERREERQVARAAREARAARRKRTGSA